MADTREPSPRSGRVYKRGKVEKDKKDKTKSPGQRLEESGDYIDTGELNSAGKPLMIKGNLMGEEGSKINPNRKPLTEKDKKLWNRKGSGQEGSKTAEQILKKRGVKDTSTLPPFLQQVLMSRPDYAGESQPAFDRAMEEYRRLKDTLKPRERIDRLKENATLRNTLKILQAVPMKAVQIGWEGLKIGGGLATGALNPRGI